MTCAPGDETYELYGHTALRIKWGNDDIVYNYGYFNFKRPHFVWHFILGETDYSLRPMTMAHFYRLYTDEGRWIDEQVLNLTPEEATRLAAALEENKNQAMLENWTYRYNYLTDNCTTRAISQIVKALNGEFVLPTVERTTYRQALHIYTIGHPWAQLGNDMLLGAGSDKEIDASGQLFLPIEAEELLQSAQVRDTSGMLRPLVTTRIRIADLPDKPADNHWPPIVWVCLLLLLTTAVTLYEWRSGKTWWLYDVIWLLFQGIAGCIIAFMLCFSEHPTVDSNLLISWLNPLPLVFLWFVIQDFRHSNSPRYFWLQIAMLGVFYILALLHKQDFPAETLLLALCLLIRAAWLVLRPKLSKPRYAQQ